MNELRDERATTTEIGEGRVNKYGCDLITQQSGLIGP